MILLQNTGAWETSLKNLHLLTQLETSCQVYPFRMEYDKLAVNNQVYTWSEALGEVVDPQGARVVTGRDGSVSPQR